MSRAASNTSGRADAPLVPKVTTTGGSPASRNSTRSSSSVPTVGSGPGSEADEPVVGGPVRLTLDVGGRDEPEVGERRQAGIHHVPTVGGEPEPRPVFAEALGEHHPIGEPRSRGPDEDPVHPPPHVGQRRDPRVLGEQDHREEVADEEGNVVLLGRHRPHHRRRRVRHEQIGLRHLGLDRAVERVEVGDGELAEVQHHQHPAAEASPPPGHEVGVLVEQRRPEVGAGVDAPERLGTKQRMELAGNDIGDVVAGRRQRAGDRNIRKDVAPIGHRVNHDASHRQRYPCSDDGPDRTDRCIPLQTHATTTRVTHRWIRRGERAELQPCGATSGSAACCA